MIQSVVISAVLCSYTSDVERKIVIHLPESCFKIFTSDVNYKINNRSFIVDTEYLGMTLSNEPIIHIHTEGFTFIIK
jgi:hypothetical protein